MSRNLTKGERQCIGIAGERTADVVTSFSLTPPLLRSRDSIVGSEVGRQNQIRRQSNCGPFARYRPVIPDQELTEILYWYPVHNPFTQPVSLPALRGESVLRIGRFARIKSASSRSVQRERTSEERRISSGGRRAEIVHGVR